METSQRHSLRNQKHVEATWLTARIIPRARIAANKGHIMSSMHSTAPATRSSRRGTRPWTKSKTGYGQNPRLREYVDWREQIECSPRWRSKPSGVNLSLGATGGFAGAAV